MRTLSLYLLLLLAVAVRAGEIPPEKDVIVFELDKLGTVTFLHKMHAGLDGVECTTCHHRGTVEAQPEDCHNCHKSDAAQEAPKAVKAFHTRCRGCHQYSVESGLKAGPVKCTLCHIKAGRH